MKEQSGIGLRRDAAIAEGSREYKERRAKIIEVAARVFRQKGYASTTLADIAEAFGVDRASLYYYVPGKQRLFEEVISEAVAANIRHAEDIEESDAAPDEKLRLLCVDLMESYAAHYPYLYVYIQENMNDRSDSAPLSPELNALNRRYERTVIAIVREGIECGILRTNASPRVIAYGIIGMLNWTYRWYAPEDHEPAAAIGQAYADMILCGLRKC